MDYLLTIPPPLDAEYFNLLEGLSVVWEPVLEGLVLGLMTMGF